MYPDGLRIHAIDRAADQIDGLMAQCAPDSEASGLLVGLSGGPDSVFLLLAARMWADRNDGYLVAAHLNHEIRPGDAEADEAFCRSLCETHGVPLAVHREDPRPSARARGMGTEEAGRYLRYRFFDRLITADENLKALATGHHRDDQAETVVMRMFRGTGPDGFAGIPRAEGNRIRPLLGFSRSEILAALELAGQPWRTDATNLDGDNTRARIRRELWPVVQGIFGPSSRDNPARLAELLDDDVVFLDGMARDHLNALTGGDESQELDVPGLLQLAPPLARRVLRAWLLDGACGERESTTIGRVHVDDTLTWLRKGQSGSGLDLPGGVRLVRNFDRLARTTDGNLFLRDGRDYRIVVRSETDAWDPETEDAGRLDDETTWKLTCPATVLQGNLRVRNWRSGDRFQPFGMEGTKKLSDLFRERRIGAESRPGILVVTDEAGILWAVGVARSERTRLLPSDGAVVTISVAERMANPNQGNESE